MKCPHCLATSLVDSHRCERCGRRYPGSTRGAAAVDFHPIVTTAAAPDYAWLRDERSSTATAVDEQPLPARRVSYQRPLFDTPVLEFPAPPGMERRRSGRRRSPLPKPEPSARSDRRYVHARQRANANQQSFEFQLVEEHNLELPPQDVIYCDAPVAQPVHRLLASALDFSMIGIALGLFLTTFHLMGGTVVLNSMTAALYGGIGVVLWFFYAALFSVCGADTPGMVWMGLRLVNFEGDRPDREQRIYRILGSVLGFLSAGLGLIWPLGDEEQLTWHDHISRTFPSPIQL
jgi:uncharacterized RDD family membrane protein YckC